MAANPPSGGHGHGGYQSVADSSASGSAFKRHINVGTQQTQTFVTNFVRTSRYNGIDFIPRNLFEQLTEPANAYFLAIGLLQIFPTISTTNGVPTMYLPLSFILLVSAARAALEDYRRHQVDDREASKEYLVFDRTSKTFVRKPSGDIVVGDIVKMMTHNTEENNDEPPLPVEFPADMLFVASSIDKGHCFVETASLDGETNLKTKNAISQIQDAIYTGNPRTEEAKLASLVFMMQCEEPNVQLHAFRGIVRLTDHEPVALAGSNLLLRGTELRNTKYLYGLVVYTGPDTKIRQNITAETKGQDGVAKKSSVMKKVDKLLVGMLGMQVALCLCAAFWSGIWYSDNRDNWYLWLDAKPIEEACLRFFTWFIILSQMVPISLLVSTEIVKTTQARFISWDPNIYDEANKTPTVVRTSVLNEDLGQIEYIFSDKTGTLTQNKMEFRVAFVRANMFGDPESEIAKRVQMREEEARLRDEGRAVEIEHVPWKIHLQRLLEKKAALGKGGIPFGGGYKDRMLTAMWGPKGGAPPSSDADIELARLVRLYVTHMGISNTITPISKVTNGVTTYVFQASSPDELALCQFAQYMGFQFISRSREGTLLKIDKQGYGDGRAIEENYVHLATLDFNSKRKRVTLIYTRNAQVYVMCKGADSEVLPLIHQKNDDDVKLQKNLNADLVEMAKKGLRTMLVTSSERPESWWNDPIDGKGESPKGVWNRISVLPDAGTERGHTKGECADTCAVCAGLNKIEMAAQMYLLGATALEDKLQDLVPECIDDFLKAGVKVWMLTGDKRETAKNIGLACNLIDPGMELIDMPHKKDAKQLNRLIHVTGHWAQPIPETELRDLFRSLVGGSIVEAALTGEESKTRASVSGYLAREDLRRFLQAIRVPHMEDAKIFNTMFDKVDKQKDGKISFDEFKEFFGSAKIRPFQAVQTDVREGLARVHELRGAYPVSMVLEGSAFEEIYPPEEKRLAVGAPSAEELQQLQNDFFALAVNCKSCVCCRLTPSQKGKIVAEMRSRQNVVTLAVGDGGNDCVMIKQANVGVGITGEEGTAASRAADYAIGQFRFLHGLLFVHGWWNYRRISKLILYIFYKTTLVALSMFYFGFFSAFSGQQFFNDVAYQLYNVAFTAGPVMILAIFDQGLDRDTLEDFPKSYGAVVGAKMFNGRLFALWIGRAFLHAAMIFFFVYNAVGTENVGNSDMKDNGLWFASFTQYTAVVLLATLRILLDMATITKIHHLVVWGSVVMFFVLIILICVNPRFNVDVYMVSVRVLSSASAWFTIIMAVALPILIDVGTLAISHAVKPPYTQLLRERDWLSAKHDAPVASVLQARRNSRDADQSPVAAYVPPSMETKLEVKKVSKRAVSPPLTEPEDAVMAAAVLYTMRFQNLSGSALEASAVAAILHHSTSPSSGSAVPSSASSSIDSKTRTRSATTELAAVRT